MAESLFVSKVLLSPNATQKTGMESKAPAEVEKTARWLSQSFASVSRHQMEEGRRNR